jgi:hypothetical protein
MQIASNKPTHILYAVSVNRNQDLRFFIKILIADIETNMDFGGFAVAEDVFFAALLIKDADVYDRNSRGAVKPR